jgi:hypothetical protein
VFSSLVETGGVAQVCFAWRRGLAVTFGGDELVEPSDFAIHGLEPVLLQLQGVAVELLPRAPERSRDLLPALLEAAAPALEDLQADVGVGLSEEREAHAEALVLPCRRAPFGKLILQPLLALGGELVDDPAAAAGDGGVGRGVVRGEQPGREHVLQAGVERAVGDRPERSEQRVDPFAQFVAVQGRLVEQAEDGELQHAGPLAHRDPSVTEICLSDVSN